MPRILGKETPRLVLHQPTASDVGFWSWLGRRGVPREDPRMHEWKREWAAALLALDPASTQALRAKLDGFGLPEDDVEIEREMLGALDDAAALANEIRTSGLPVVETGHRVVAHERCHFSASATMPDEPGQPSGRLLLTSGRAIFVGGAHAVATAWHTIGDVQQTERAVVLVRAARDRFYRFQCNSYGDALRATLVARELVRKSRPPAVRL